MLVMVDLYKVVPKMTVASPYLIPGASVPSSICWPLLSKEVCAALGFLCQHCRIWYKIRSL